MSVQLDLNRIPRHIAIIMDGNGRWAKARGQERTVGHQQGAQQVHEIMEEAVRLRVDYLTLYTFSTENWNRPKEEITALMALLLQHLDEDTFMKNNARFKVIGDVHRLSPIVQDAVAHLADITKNNTNTCMVVALSYSSKWELTKAMKDIATEVEQGKLKSTDITEDTINQHLETKGMPEPELMIRTGGELRLSNYLLWQCAYSEFYFTDVYWPDFTIDEFHKAIADYQGRQRRYGKTGDQIVEETNK
ncbi:MAG: isoprenyl transferase [Bacteroidaceae bacterium]|nr:isoprenyl transferase [Bacteroidaceae bacterium]